MCLKIICIKITTKVYLYFEWFEFQSKTGIEETYYISNAIIKIVLKICVTNFLSPELYNRTYYHISTIGCFSRDFILQRDFILNLLGSIVYETRLSSINFCSVTPTLTIVYLKEDHVVSINIYACIQYFAQ